jgi:hypothetical protein
MNEQDFIDKVLSEWDTAYARKHEQKEFLRIILNRLQKLEQSDSSLISGEQK